MKLPIEVPAKTEEVKWPTVAFAVEMASSIAKKKKKKKKVKSHDETLETDDVDE